MTICGIIAEPNKYRTRDKVSCMRLNRKEHLLLFDEPLSVAEENAYFTTIESFPENHAYSCARRMPSYPSKPAVTALQLSRSPSLMSAVSSLSPRTPSTRSFRRYAQSIASTPSLSRSQTTKSSVSGMFTPEMPAYKFSTEEIDTTTPCSPSSMIRIIESIDYDLMNESLSAFKIQQHDEVRPKSKDKPTAAANTTRSSFRKKATAGMSLKTKPKAARKSESTLSRPVSLPLPQTKARKIKTLSRLSEDTNVSVRSLAGRSTLVNTKPESIYDRVIKNESGIKTCGVDVFDFELPGFDPCLQKVVMV